MENVYGKYIDQDNIQFPAKVYKNYSNFDCNQQALIAEGFLPVIGLENTNKKPQYKLTKKAIKVSYVDQPEQKDVSGKLQSINNKTKEKIIQGFSCNIADKEYWFKFSIEDQLNINRKGLIASAAIANQDFSLILYYKGYADSSFQVPVKLQVTALQMMEIVKAADDHYDTVQNEKSNLIAKIARQQ